MDTSFYKITANSLQGKAVNLNVYKDKVVLVVNTASQCGFTPQLKGLEDLYRKYKDQGLVILGFPCNQFGNQEPGSADEIQKGCLMNYGVTFPVFEKTKVNGEESHQLYRWLKAQQKGWGSKRIKWNFTKFLLDREGNLVKRFSPATKPQSLEKHIQSLL